MTNHFAQLLETVCRVGSRQPSWPGLRVDCCPFPPLMVSQCQGGISAGNGEYFLISVSEPYASFHLQLLLGVSESPAMVLLKGIVASDLCPRWQKPRSIYCPRSYSDRFTVILSSPIVAVRSFVRLLSLRGGGVFPAWTLGVECTCCVDTTLAVPLSVASHDLPAYQQVWTEHTVPQPSVRFVVLICGGAFRPNDYSSMMRKVMPQLLVIVIDWAVGGHQHDYEIESVNLWICSLVGSALCLLVIAGPECGPWCALRGVGAGPGILFSLDFPDGKLDGSGAHQNRAPQPAPSNGA